MMFSTLSVYMYMINTVVEVKLESKGEKNGQNREPNKRLKLGQKEKEKDVKQLSIYNNCGCA